MKALAIALSSVLILLANRSAVADNYTGRSSRSSSSASVTPAIEPESAPAQLPSLEPAAAAVEPAAPDPVIPEPVVPEPVVPKEPALAPVESAAPAPKVEKVWLDGQLPEGAQTEGEWIWSPDPGSGAAAVHSHPPVKGVQAHRFSGDPADMPGNGMIVQQVWLDPQNPPQGISLRFKLASGEEVGVYWEGEKEVFTPTEYEELWYYGMLPELGKWVSLEILAEDLGLEDTAIAGVTFSTFDGQVLWGKTVITEAPPLEGEETGEENPNVSSDEVFKSPY